MHDSAVVERLLPNPRVVSSRLGHLQFTQLEVGSLVSLWGRYSWQRKELATLLHMPRLNTIVALPALPQSSEYETRHLIDML